MLSLDLFALDRDIARGVRAVRAFHRALRRDLPRAEEDHPLASVRWVSGQTSFDEISKLQPDDPLREPLRRWIFHLALVRIAREPTLRVARAWHEESLRLERPEPLQTSPRDLVGRILRERVLAKRALFIEGLSAGAPRLSQIQKDRDEALVEIASRLGVEDPWSMWLGFSHAESQALARDLLDRTEDLAGQLFAGANDPSDFLELLLARDVKGSFPQRTGRWVEPLFLRTPLLAGLSIDPGRMPEALGASSFVRALARFGAAYTRAALPREAPFVLANDPADLHPQRRGALFASLLAEPVFLQRAMGLSRDEARAAKRVVARSILGSLRFEAARTLSGDARTPAGDVEDLLSRASFVEWPRPLAHVLPRASFLAPVRLIAAISAAEDRLAMIQRFDEDWFRNPHALRHLREEDGTLAPRALDAEDLRNRCLPRLASTLLEAAS